MNETEHVPGGDAVEEDLKPFVAPCNDLKPGDTLKWLKAGWADYRAAPGLSLAWGCFCCLLSWAVAWLAWRAGGMAWLIGLVTGFVFVAPLLAFAMYSVSRKICMGVKPTALNTFRAIRRPIQYARAPRRNPAHTAGRLQGDSAWWMRSPHRDTHCPCRP